MARVGGLMDAVIIGAGLGSLVAAIMRASNPDKEWRDVSFRYLILGLGLILVGIFI